MHDPTKILLGQTQSSAKESSVFASDPADFPAGLGVRIKSTGALSVTKAEGGFAGVSLGKSLSDHKKTAVVRDGESVPVKCFQRFSSLVVGDLTFTAKAYGSSQDAITIALSDDVSAGDEVVVVTDLDIVISMEDGVSTAAQIKAAIDASEDALALVGVEIAVGESATAQDAAAEDNLADGLEIADYAVIGEKAYVDDASGLFTASTESNVTICDAIYVSGALIGIAEDGSEVGAILVDMPGGL